MIVVLPEPFGPSNPKIFPSRNSNEISFTAFLLAKVFDMFLTVIGNYEKLNSVPKVRKKYRLFLMKIYLFCSGCRQTLSGTKENLQIAN